MVQAYQEKFGLDKPLYVQYLNYMSDLIRFDFGFSGLKTAALNLVRQLERDGEDIHEASLAADLAAYPVPVR